MESGGLETKDCPDCAESVKYDARVCRYCGFRFDSAPEPVIAHIAPEAEPAPIQRNTGPDSVPPVSETAPPQQAESPGSGGCGCGIVTLLVLGAIGYFLLGPGGNDDTERKRSPGQASAAPSKPKAGFTATSFRKYRSGFNRLAGTGLSYQRAFDACLDGFTAALDESGSSSDCDIADEGRHQGLAAQALIKVLEESEPEMAEGCVVLSRVTRLFLGGLADPLELPTPKHETLNVRFASLGVRQNLTLAGVKYAKIGQDALEETCAPGKEPLPTEDAKREAAHLADEYEDEITLATKKFDTQIGYAEANRSCARKNKDGTLGTSVCLPYDDADTCVSQADDIGTIRRCDRELQKALNEFADIAG